MATFGPSPLAPVIERRTAFPNPPHISALEGSRTGHIGGDIQKRRPVKDVYLRDAGNIAFSLHRGNAWRIRPRRCPGRKGSALPSIEIRRPPFRSARPEGSSRGARCGQSLRDFQARSDIPRRFQRSPGFLWRGSLLPSRVLCAYDPANSLLCVKDCWIRSGAEPQDCSPVLLARATASYVESLVAMPHNVEDQSTTASYGSLLFRLVPIPRSTVYEGMSPSADGGNGCGP